MMVREKVVLASASKIRAQMLKDAGLDVEISPATIDENVVKAAIFKKESDMPPADFAEILAKSKANSISEIRAGDLVIGADQILVLNGEIYDKPRSKDEARDQLVTLRGKTHKLITAVAVARHGGTIWSYSVNAELTMRDFSNTFLGYYLAEMGEDITSSVGGYKLKGPGVQLFSKIEGDYFSILGLPLLALLEFLRGEDVLYV
jgi:septum formation protein